MNFKDKDAIYLQIADYVSENIVLGKWPPEGKIPSVRELAANGHRVFVEMSAHPVLTMPVEVC